ncbi:thymocyte selection-associated high mobility group box protein TOX [Galendromus occidentalis]|uniref:Thymocyte selection-associated high mobility group box protein TOX n=1 Tax=Galendromus occidentalis TaxID=34638 RepID=A0AAJ7P9X4_9ACAR|nr:thymocyte selection-associated high mobility group box protein TOX [Galendromus occidentalis]
MDPPQLPWQTFDGQQTLNLSTAAAAAASQFYMQDYINSGGSSFNSFQQLHSNYPSLQSAESTSTTPASTSSVSPGTIASIGSISSLGLQAAQKQNGVTKQKIQRKRKKKDPNEPQKPVSAYALFFRDTQSHIKSQNPNATFGQISKIVASMWDQLDADRKEVYKKKTEAAKKEYLKALAAYRASLVQSPQTSTSPQNPTARSPLSTPSISSFQSTLGQNFNANLMNGLNSSLGFSQSNGNLATMAMPMAMGGQAMANLANFSQMGSQWTQDSAKLGFSAQNWPPAAHSNSNMHSVYLGTQMHALSSQLGMAPWDHRTR